MAFSLNEDQILMQDMALQFAQGEMLPFASEWDENKSLPIDVLRKAAELGFGALYVSEDDGGSGLSRLDAVIVFQALATACPSTTAFLTIHNMGTWMISAFGNQELKEKILPSLCTMDKLISYCLTEPQAGSDAASLKTNAKIDGDHYVINGTKSFISGGGLSDYYLTMVRTGDEGPKGISAVLIEKDREGVSFGAQERKLGWNSQPTAQVNFDDVRIPITNRIGTEGEGFKIAMKGLDGGRLNISACSLGGAQYCIEKSKEYMQERSAFGKKLSEFQALGFKLADMEIDFNAAQALLYTAAAKLDRAEPDASKFSTMAKRFATDAGFEIVNQALQIHGGYGYLKDYQIERYLRDLRVHQILEGTNEIMRLIVAREMFNG